jgi:positive regulator of sigma E activity
MFIIPYFLLAWWIKLGDLIVIILLAIVCIVDFIIARWYDKKYREGKK